MDRPIDKIDLDKVDSVVLRRLIEEVRADEEAGRPAAYNRVYTRHNRS